MVLFVQKCLAKSLFNRDFSNDFQSDFHDLQICIDRFRAVYSWCQGRWSEFSGKFLNFISCLLALPVSLFAVNFSRLRISDAGRRTADRTNALFGIFKKSFNGHPACTLAKRERENKLFMNHFSRNLIFLESYALLGASLPSLLLLLFTSPPKLAG